MCYTKTMSESSMISTWVRKIANTELMNASQSLNFGAINEID